MQTRIQAPTMPYSMCSLTQRERLLGERRTLWMTSSIQMNDA